MTQRFPCLSLAALILGFSTLPGIAQNITPAAPTPVPTLPGIVADTETPVSLQLNDADVSLILVQIEMLTGRIVLRPPNLPAGKFTIPAKPMPKAEALLAVETLLNLNGIALVPLGDKFIKVVPIQQARFESPVLISGSTLELPASGAIATKIFQLEFIRAGEFMQQFNLLFNPSLGTAPVPFEKSNAVMVTDAISTLQRIETLLKQVDRPPSLDSGIKFYTARHAKASDLVNKLRTIIQSGLQQQVGNSVSLNADDRTNQIILTSDARQHAFFDLMIEKLDIKADPNTRNEVIYLKHATAKDVATLISNIVSEKTKAATNSGSVRPIPGALAPGQPPTPGPAQPSGPGEAISGVLSGATSQEFSANITIQSDERSNALVVAGTVDDIRIIQDLVNKIDILLAQVRIEVVIAEVTLDDNATSGISALNLSVQNNKIVGFTGSTAGLTLEGLGTGLNPAQAFLNDMDQLSGLIRVSGTPRKNNTTILSRPNITTTHNKEATVFVGETRPVISATQTTPGSNTGLTTSSQVSQQEIGITLKVKPLIGNDGSVQLDIEQEVSDVIGDVTIDNNSQPIIGKRKNKSFVSVKSGEIIAIGGIQRKKDSKRTNRLGPIPFIGDLLGSRVREDNRTELVFFLRPLVLSNTPADNQFPLHQVDGMPHGAQVRKALDLPPATPEPKPEQPALKRPR